jgi:hypothetical protein
MPHPLNVREKKTTIPRWCDMKPKMLPNNVKPFESPHHCSNLHVLLMTHANLSQIEEGFHMVKNHKPKILFILKKTTFGFIRMVCA